MHRSYVIVVEDAGVAYKVCRIVFGGDGSFYVAAPYHPARSALIAKMTVNYELVEQTIHWRDAEEIAVLDDDEKRLKLSHHPDGFIQLSGHGVISGRRPDGTIRGMGLVGWPLHRPIIGPAFGLTIFGLQAYERVTTPPTESRTLRVSAIFCDSPNDPLMISGYYLPWFWRRFIRRDDMGNERLAMAHPAGPILELSVLPSAQHVALPGMIGVELASYPGSIESHESGFVLCSSTGNLHKNDRGHVVGTQLVCAFPKLVDVPARRLRFELGDAVGRVRQSTYSVDSLDIIDTRAADEPTIEGDDQ